MACRFKKYRVQTPYAKERGIYYIWSLNSRGYPQIMTVIIATGRKSEPRPASTMYDVLRRIEEGTSWWYVP